MVGKRNGNAIIRPLTMEDKITANKLPFGLGIIYSDTVYESTGFLNGGEYVADGLASQVMDNIKSTPLGDK